MALNLPNLKTITPGKSTGLAIRTAGTGAPKNLFGGGSGTIPKIKAPAQHQVSPYDQFTLADPYNAKQIPTLAQAGWTTDTQNAQHLAQMGYPTAAATTADYAARGAAANQIQQDLAAHLASMRDISVAQGNAGGAALGTQNAAAAATMPNIPGATPAENPIPTAGAQGVIAAQTAATGNYGNALQAAALSSGAQANQRAIDAGTVANTNNQNDVQKTLASLLSGIPTESSREATMAGDNQKVDASNLQSGLSVWQQLESDAQLDKQLGNKVKSQQESERAAQLLAGINNRGANYRSNISATASANNTAANNATSTANNTADNVAAGQRTQAQITAANKRAREANIAKGLTAAGKPARGYTVGVRVMKPGPKDLLGNPTTKLVRVPKKFTAQQWKAFVASGPQGKRKLALLGLPEGSKVDVTSAVGY